MWRDTAAMPEYGRLEGDVRTDVLVIGGGMAGILCAHFLRQAGVDCVLAEADRLCAGTTGNTTAMITSSAGWYTTGCCAASARKRRGCTCTPTRRRWRATAACAGRSTGAGSRKDAFVYP
ncbi:MAG: FAD-dependent oxidoreductase [Ruthenibacterium lactatiformans]